MKLYPILLIVALFTVSACKKKDTTPDRTTLLTQKEWVVTAERSQKNSESWKDEFTSSACVKDNRIIFYKTGKYDITEGPTKCSSTDGNYVEQNESWAFKDNQTKITMTHNGGYDLTIVQLDENTLKLLHQYQSAGNTFKEETILSHP